MALPVKETMMEVVVDDDCNKTVDRIPTIKPATGFMSSPNKAPA